MGPASHPIRGEVSNVEEAMANFDAITYVKGESVLKQLVAYVGEDAFVEGLRAYFREHAWGNTRLADLMSAVGAAAGRDLTGWTAAWFDRAGTDTLSLRGGDLVASGPDGEEPRPHRLDIASFVRDGDKLVPVGLVPVVTDGSAHGARGAARGPPAPAQPRRPDVRCRPDRRGVAADDARGRRGAPRPVVAGAGGVDGLGHAAQG